MDFDDYQRLPKCLSFEEMHNLHKTLLSLIKGDEIAQELYDELIDASVQYANMRGKWYLMTQEERIEQDKLRTSYHDSVIVHLNMLCRYLKQNEKDVTWRNTLGYEEDNIYNRKRMGDFGCYLAFISALSVR